MSISDEELHERDKVERLESCVCQMERCCGGHMMLRGFVCQLCESDDPRYVCFKEQVRYGCSLEKKAHKFRVID